MESRITFDHSVLRKKLKEAKISGPGAAWAIGIDQATFSRKICGHWDFSETQIYRLADLLSLTPGELCACFFVPAEEG